MRRLQLSKSHVLLTPALLTLALLAGGSFIGTINQLHFVAEAPVIDASVFMPAFFRSFYIACLSTLLSLGLSLGILFLFFLRKYHRDSNKHMITTKLLLLPMLFPYFTAAFLIYITLSNTGLVSRVLFHMGLLSDSQSFIPLTNDPFAIGIIVTYIWKATPFMLLLFLPKLTVVDSQSVEMARSYGASSRFYFQAVFLPLLRNTVIFTSLVVFSFTFTAFETPFLLGVTYPKTLSVLTYELYTTGDIQTRTAALTYSAVLFSLTFIIGFIAFHYGDSLLHKKEDA